MNYLYYYEQIRKKSNFLVGQLLDATCFSMKYLLKSTYHSDIFRKRIESMFTVTDVNSDGHCGFSSIVLCLKHFNICNDNLTHMNLRKEMSKIIKEGSESYLLLQASFEAFSDINVLRISQTASVRYIIYTLMERIFKKEYFEKK